QALARAKDATFNLIVAHVAHLLTSSQLTLFLDGLDEVVPKQQLDSHLEVLKQCPGRVLVCSRPFAYDGNMFGNPPRFELAPLRRLEQRRFMDKWFVSEPHRAEALRKIIDDNPQVSDIAGNPLLLTLTCWVYARGKSLSAN